VHIGHVIRGSTLSGKALPRTTSKNDPQCVQMKLTSAICTRRWRSLWVVGNGAELRV
jgi:hypothetical protein